MAQEVTPERDPHTNGTRDGWIGSHEGVGPCSPDRRRPKRCRMPSYSMKYRAVPDVSRTVSECAAQKMNKTSDNDIPKWRRKPVYSPTRPLVLMISRTASMFPGGFLS